MERKAEPEHELTEIPSVTDLLLSRTTSNFYRQDNMATALLSNDEGDRSRDPMALSKPDTQDFLRHNRLQILGLLFGRFLDWRKEPRKFAIHRNRRIAAYHCLFHLIPLSGAITLLVLRWTQYWIGLNAPDATTLQFVAKFHELLMQVSIMEVMLCIIRSEAMNGFVPLGALSAATQPTQLSYLWSFDFLSIFTSDAFRGRGWRRIGMIIAIPVLLISTALVGPSSAVLMVPDPNSPYMEHEWIMAYDEDHFYPTKLNSTQGLTT